MPCVRGLRDAEYGNDAAWAGDLDLCDQRFDERFALAVRAGGDDLVDVIGDLDERGGWRHHRFCVELAGEFVAAGRELPGPCVERGEPVGEVFGVQGAVLERGQVPVGRRAGPGQLVLGRGQFGASALVGGGVTGSRGGLAGSSPVSGAVPCCQAVISTASAVTAWSRCGRLMGVVAMRSTRTGAGRLALGRGGGMAVCAPCRTAR
jgi:hypothetical protein